MRVDRRNRARVLILQSQPEPPHVVVSNPGLGIEWNLILTDPAPERLLGLGRQRRVVDMLAGFDIGSVDPLHRSERIATDPRQQRIQYVHQALPPPLASGGRMPCPAA